MNARGQSHSWKSIFFYGSFFIWPILVIFDNTCIHLINIVFYWLLWAFYWLFVSLFCRWVPPFLSADPETSEPISTLFHTFLDHGWLAVMFACYLHWWCNFPLPALLPYWVSGEQIHAVLFCDGLISPYTWRGTFAWRVGSGSALRDHRFFWSAYGMFNSHCDKTP